MDISCIICTRDRADSLRVTLECLAIADRSGLQCEVVVVDNGSKDATAEVVGEFDGRLEVRYLLEPTVGNYGKVHCLNRALDSGELGAIVAILDDDMSPESGWFQGVASACQRWPEIDIFTGRSHIVWPIAEVEVPVWAKGGRIRGWAYSVMGGGEEDRKSSPGRWFSTNHVWFRARVLDCGWRSEDFWNGEAAFQLDLQNDGHRSVCVHDVTTGHRIQPDLLDFGNLKNRARLVGRTFARIRLKPFRSDVVVASAFKRSPLLVRLYCVAAWMAWSMRHLFASLMSHFSDRWLEECLVSIERKTYFRSLLRIASKCPEYSICRRFEPSNKN